MNNAVKPNDERRGVIPRLLGCCVAKFSAEKRRCFVCAAGGGELCMDVFWEEAQQSVCFICDWQTLFSLNT